MTAPTFRKTSHGIEVPTFFYGTAWKDNKTEPLVTQALRCGFGAIDTANQRKHYYEEGTGNAINAFLKSGAKTREELFIQTKFTFPQGQDHRKPYDVTASSSVQVRQSFEKSLEHLRVSYLDSLLLHGPFTGYGLMPEDLDAWNAIENIYREKKVKCIGVSNFNLLQLKELYQRATVKPHFIQNRCFAAMEWDREIREFCLENHILYQGFSLLTANQKELLKPKILILAQRYHKSVPQIVFRFCYQVGMIILTGTSSEDHMRSDLSIHDFELSSREIETIELEL